MRIFLAGAAGAIGRQLVPMLLDAGHVVTGTTRSAERAQWLEEVGATPAVVDAYDAEALHAAVASARPEVVIHELTDLTLGFELEEVAKTARLREIATRTLVDAAVATGSRRFVAQSGAWQYADGPIPHDETHPLRTPTDAPKDAGLRGIIALERIVGEAHDVEGVILRYGFFDGPGTTYEPGAAPPPRVSVSAAARATLLALDHGPAGTYNVVDDDPAISNRRARELLGWQPG